MFPPRGGKTEIAEILIEKGVNINARNREEESPLDIKQKTFPLDSDEAKTARKKTADLLPKHGGKTGEELKAEGK